MTTRSFKPTIDRVMWAPSTAMPPYFGLCLSKKAWDKLVKDYNLEGIDNVSGNGNDATCMIFANGKNPKQTFILITLADGWQKKPILTIFGLLVHECVHAFDQMCERIGEHNPSSEFKAYFIQMLFQNFADSIMKLKGKMRGTKNA